MNKRGRREGEFNMANENIKQLSEILGSAGYEITSYSEERDIYTILKIKLEITPSHKDKNNDSKNT